MANRPKRLYRDARSAKIGGVCAGLAEYFNIDVTLIRLAMIAFAVAGGSGVLFYVLAWIVMPEKGDLDLDPKK